jgi:hypothetical protein
MAAASDPSKLGLFRRDYITIAKQLEQIDAAVLNLLKDMQGIYQDGRVSRLMQRLSLSQDQIVVSLAKLHQLGLVTEGSPNPELLPLGRQFMLILSP